MTEKPFKKKDFMHLNEIEYFSTHYMYAFIGLPIDNIDQRISPETSNDE